MTLKKISFAEARKLYGGGSEKETILNMAKSERFYRIYKCKDNSFRYAHFVGSNGPQDLTEIEVFMSPDIPNAVAVFMDGCVFVAGPGGNVVGHEDSKHVWENQI